jgi:hypothetical protein
MEKKLLRIFKQHEIILEQVREQEWEAYIILMANIHTDRQLVPGGPFPTEEKAHKNAIDFLVLHK